MNCFACGSPMKGEKRNHRYTESGLPNVELVAVPVFRCTKCDEEEVSIPAILELHRVIAQSLLLKRQRLAPAEIRFLRKYLGENQVSMAQTLGVAPETVSRWEGGHQMMDVPAEKLLRMVAATKAPVARYERELASVAVAKQRNTPMRVRREAEGWRVA